MGQVKRAVEPGPDAAFSPITSPSTLRGSQYAEVERLRAREALWDSGSGPSVAEGWLEAVSLAGDETVLDVGCGYGRYLALLRRKGHRGRLLGVDLSDGMARAAGRSGVPVVVADVTRLPLPDASVDVVLAMHVLYHVADPRVAVRELRRVLRSGGRVLASANGAGHAAEIRIVMNAASRTVTGRSLGIGELSFTLENGADHLGASFTVQERRDSTRVVDLRNAEPVVAYVESFGPELTGVPLDRWDRFLAETRRLVDEHIREFGVFTVTRLPGAFVCR